MHHTRSRAPRAVPIALAFLFLAMISVACDTSVGGENPDESTTGGGSSEENSGGTSSGGTPAGDSGGAAAGGASAGGAGAGGGGTGGASSGGAGSGGGGNGGNGSGGDGTGGSSDVVPSPGCTKTSTLTFGPVPTSPPDGFGDGGYVTIQSGGESRGFAMRLPNNYDNTKPYWLIFGFHWNGGNSKEVDSGGTNGYNMSHFGLQKLSENGAIFVAPQGIGNGWANSNGRDLTFVDDMVELITENYCVDMNRLFANGFSYGGGMSYGIACDRADVFRGVAIYNGAVLSGCQNGNDPIAYWQMAGLTDGTTTMAMGEPMRDRFIENNGCTPQNAPQPPMPPPYLSDGGHICTDYECESDYPLRWCVHQSGHGNAVVDGTGDLWNGCATPPNSCSDECPCTWVPEDVWNFFNSL